MDTYQFTIISQSIKENLPKMPMKKIAELFLKPKPDAIVSHAGEKR